MSVALAIHTIPQANISEVVGLASVVTPEARNIFALGDELGYEFSKLLVVIKSAELLDLVTTPGENVMLTETGRQFLAADVSRRREILREKMLGLPLFNRLVRLIEEAPDRLISIVDLFEHLKELVSKRKISRNSRGPSSDGADFRDCSSIQASRSACPNQGATLRKRASFSPEQCRKQASELAVQLECEPNFVTSAAYRGRVERRSDSSLHLMGPGSGRHVRASFVGRKSRCPRAPAWHLPQLRLRSRRSFPWKAWPAGRRSRWQPHRGDHAIW